jgi:hypothetical protein
MSIKMSAVVLSMTMMALGSTQAFAVRANERPPPNGMNGPSVQGFNEARPFPGKDSDQGFPGPVTHSSSLTSVTFPDSSRVIVK